MAPGRPRGRGPFLVRKITRDAEDAMTPTVTALTTRADIRPWGWVTGRTLSPYKPNEGPVYGPAANRSRDPRPMLRGRVYVTPAVCSQCPAPVHPESVR